MAALTTASKLASGNVTTESAVATGTGIKAKSKQTKTIAKGRQCCILKKRFGLTLHPPMSIPVLARRRDSLRIILANKGCQPERGHAGM